MSTEAANHYSEIARRFADSSPIPTVLSGEAYLLSDPELRISVRTPYATEAIARYRHVLTVAGAFVLHHSLQPDLEEPPVDTTGLPNCLLNVAGSRNLWDYATEVTSRGRLIPKKKAGSSTSIVTGYIKDVQVEAVTPADVPPAVLTRATRKYPKSSERDDNVLLVESAELVLGRSLGRVAHLTVVTPDQKEPDQYRLLGAPFGKNDLLAASGLWQSRANATYIQTWGILSAVTQNVRRGEQQRGSKR
jgi:hypothetical protein